MKIQGKMPEIELPDEIGEAILAEQKQVNSGERIVSQTVYLPESPWSYRMEVPVIWEKVD